MDKERFLELLLAAEETLFHITFSILKNEHDCADAVQETILKAYASRQKLKSEEFFKTWIVRIAINESYAIIRKRKKYVEWSEQAKTDAEKFGGHIKEEYLDLYKAVSKLDEKTKICIILFYFEDYSVAEVAGILGLPKGTVKSRLNRGRTLLKDLLEGENDYEFI